MRLPPHRGPARPTRRRVESAYFPWASGLNALLDSLVDLDEDPEGASHLRRYDSPDLAAERLQMIASGARRRVSELPDGRLHEAILAAMGALYFAQPEAWRPGREPISRAVFAALGPFARPSLAGPSPAAPRSRQRAPFWPPADASVPAYEIHTA